METDSGKDNYEETWWAFEEEVASVTEVEGNHTMNSGSQGASGLSLYGTSEQGFQSIRGAVQKSGPCFSVVFFLRRKKICRRVILKGNLGDRTARAALGGGVPTPGSPYPLVLSRQTPPASQ